jgi:hypothetical protein
MATNNIISILTVQNTGTQNTGLPIQIAISPCAGDFSGAGMPAGCMAYSNVEAGQVWIAMSQNTGNKYQTSCVLSPPASNAPYYVNVREVTTNGANSCLLSGQTVNGLVCSFIIQLHWGPS